jgi:PAS domain S-box-containing protein
MESRTRKSGINILGDVAWGTHFCQFYQNKKDLLDILVPYFKAGLESNEFCMWICSEPLGVGEATQAIKKAVPNFGARLNKGQIEILSHAEWYLRRGMFSSKRVLTGWIDKLNAALAAGFYGLRLSGNTFWLEKKDWRRFTDYEEEVNRVISQYPMIALCTYSLDRCGIQEVIDVINNHQLTLIRRSGKWTVIESSGFKRADAALRKSEDDLRKSRDELEKRVAERTGELAQAVEKLQREVVERQRAEQALFEKSRILDAFFASSVNPMVILDRDFNFIRVNEAYAKACQKDVSEFPGHNHFEFYPNYENEQIFRQVLKSKVPFQAQAKPFIFPDHPEWGFTYWDWNLSPILGPMGEVEFFVFALKDVTDRTLAMDQIKQKEELLRNVLEILPVGVWIVDKTGRIGQGNQTAREIWAGAEYVGLDQYGEYKGWWADTGKKIEPEEWAAARAITKGETSLNEEVEIECFDGSHKIIFNSAVPFRNNAQEITGAIIINQDITARRRGEASRREQAALLELAHDAIFDCSLDGKILFWNHGAEVIYGWSKEEALGKVSHVLLHSRFSEPLEQIIEKLIRVGRWEGEFSQVNRYGVPLFTSGRWALKVDKKGKPVGILKINIDITERKKAEDALKSSSIYSRTLIEASLDPLVTISPDGKITDVNKATEFVTGVPRESLIGSDFSNYFTDPAKAREGYEEAFLKGSIRDFPLVILHASGLLTDVLYNATVFKDESGEVQGIFAAARDITERKKAEEERLRLAKAIEQAAEGFIIMDADREILYVNPAFEKINDLRSADILRSTYDDLLRMVGREEWLGQEIASTLGLKDRWNGHMTRRKKDGSACELNVVISPLLDEAGKIKNYVAVERDVTEEVKLQNHVRQRQKMEALGTLAGGIAHDFNNLLMPILINSEMVLLEAGEGSAISRHLQLVTEAANRGKELVKQIITFSRQKEQERNPIEVGPIIKEGLKFLRASIPKNIEIVENIQQGSAIALADPTQIHQVLMNLCSNAAYAMRQKSGVLGVTLSGIEMDSHLAAQHLDLKPGSYLRLAVSDTGEGMTPEVIEKIFDPFFTTKAPGQGTGMGLAVVHGIVKGHGGAVTVYSEVGKGTTFNVYLPQIRGDEVSRRADPGLLPLGNERILFVDDENIQVRSVLPMLERLGYQADGQTNPQKALDMFRARPEAYDLVITDLTMPFLMGDQLAAELLRLRPNLPIILCTGFSETISEGITKEIGIKALLLKPFSVRTMAETVRRVLDAKA